MSTFLDVGIVVHYPLDGDCHQLTILELYCVEVIVGCCSLLELYCVEVVVDCCSLSELYYVDGIRQ